MDDEAIDVVQEELQDVSDQQEPVETEAEQQPLSAREQKLREIQEKRDAQFQDNDGEPVVEREFQQVTREDDEPEPVESKKPQQPSIVYVNDDGVEMMRLKVNGQDVERPVSQVLTTAQKHESADQRLQLAARKAQELEQRERQFQQERQQFLAQQAQPSTDAGKPVSDDTYDALLDAIYDGNKETALEKLKELDAGRQVPTLDPRQIAYQAKIEAIQEIEQRNTEREQQNSISTGIAWIENEYPQVMQDEVLYHSVDTQTKIIQQKNPTMSPDEVIKQATLSVMQRFGTPKAEESSREQAKSNLRSQPTRAANARYTPPKKEEVDMSAEAVIEREKARRLAARSIR
jgi:hypothetical protein